MSVGHYLRSMGQLTKQFNSSTYRDPKRQRLYLKDIDCPDMWAQKLQEELPDSIYYLNECIESRTGGDGAIREANEYGQMRYGKGVAPAGDLMSNLPPEMRALNMMCYIGHEGTYTPAHREMCASLGHNIMVSASSNGNGEKAGSSIWFMTETKERELVSEYFLSILGHDIEVEKHFAQVNAWKKAPFNVWVVEQKPGDLILIPPLAPHQVWNRGTRTMKAAWNRTTVDTLELAIHEALPRGRMVCRDEQYKNKAIIYYTLVKYYDLLQRDTIEKKMWKYGRIKQLLDDFKRLFSLYTEILVSEMFSPKLPEETKVQLLPFDSNVTCSYCRCNIFNRFLTCNSCIERGPNGEEDTYDICMDCYAMGRSCQCISSLDWVEQWEWDTLLRNYDQWRDIVVRTDGHIDMQRSPQPIEIARKRYGKKPIAEVCQEQLKLRPWTDISKPVVREPSPGMSDVEPEVDDNGRPRNKKKGKFTKRLQPVKNKTHTCHICCHHEWNWKLAMCSTCNLAYCYGVLWRAFDLMPQTVMEDKDWQCPKCLKNCSCGKCRKSDNQKPYEPKGTLLGHDTKKVADFRSVESLVDFSKTNLTWLRGEEDESPQKTSRMKKLKEKVEAEKSRVDAVNESYLEKGPQDPFLGAANGETEADLGDIDPSLRDTGGFASTSDGHANGHYGSFFEKDTAIAGNGDENHTNGHGLDDSNGWMDGHYELDDYDGFNNQNRNASYSSRLLAPTAPMYAEDDEYPDPSHTGQRGMMGMGYYQQANSNGVDQILFDPPSLGGLEDSQPDAYQNSNLAFSDLIPSQFEPAENTKKRKRLGEGTGSGDDNDLEFFTSKKQRKSATTKKAALVKSDFANVVMPRGGPQRQPRRSAVKPTLYADLGEDAVPIEDDEGPSAIVTYKPRPKTDQSDDDLQLAAKAFSRLTNPEESTPKAKVGRKRKSMLPQPTSKSASPAPKPQPKPRKSAWLARKEAEEAGIDFPEEVPSRNRRRLPAKEGTAKTIDISDSEPSDSDADFETDSIFGEPIEREKRQVDDEEDKDDGDFVGEKSAEPTKTKADSNESIKWRVSKDHPGVQLAEAASTAKIAPKRRGRPPKQAKARSPTPEMARPAPRPKLLSLREKLALKGKSFKIVAAKTRESIEVTPGPSSARGAPSVAIPFPSSARDTPSAASNGPASFRNTPSVAIPGLSSARSTPSIAIPPFGSPSPMNPEPDQMYSVNNIMKSNSANSVAPTSTSANFSNGMASSRNSPDDLTDELAKELATSLAAQASEQLAMSSDGERSRSSTRVPLHSVRICDGVVNAPISRSPESPVKKGPTVVRLDSPGSESEDESQGYTSDEPEIDRPEPKSPTPLLDDDSDDDSGSDTSIPAVRPGHKAVRGGGSFAQRGAPGGSVRGRGRPRGRPSLRGA